MGSNTAVRFKFVEIPALPVQVLNLVIFINEALLGQKRIRSH